MKKTLVVLLILVLVFSAFICWGYIGGPKKALVVFLDRYFVLENGAVLIESADRDTVLSESCGLYLLACARLGEKESFDRTYEFVKKELISEKGVLHWKINLKTGQKEKSSASIDDLTVVQALLEAYKLWDDEQYLKEALGIADAIMQKEVKDNYLVDSFSWDADEYASDIVNISYLDLGTMRELSGYDPQWGAVYQNCLELCLRAIMENGLFFEAYDLKTGKFSYQEGNVINQLYTALHLARSGAAAEKIKLVGFLKDSLKAQAKISIIYGKDGAAKSDNESVAVYALCARLFHALNERAYEKMCYKKMLSFREGFRYNRYYGGFGWFAPFTSRDYNSFDNLQALLTIVQE